MIKLKCSKCRKLKAITFFWRNKTRKNGFEAWCKACRKSYYNQPKYRLLHAIRTAKNIHKYPDRHKARLLADNNREKMIGDRCDNCGDNRAILHMHHKDYKKPLEVITLCVKCHEGLHHGRIIL